MKIFILVLKKISNFYTDNGIISAVYSVGFVMSVLVFVYVYNNFVPSITRTAEDDSFDHYYAFYFTDPIDDFSELREFLASYDTFYVTYYHKILNEDNSINNDDSQTTYKITTGDSENYIEISENELSEQSAIPYVVAYKDDEVRTTLVEGKLEFYDCADDNSQNFAILPAHSTLGVLPDSYEYDGITYFAIGWHVGETMIIPEENFVEQGLSIYKVEIYLDNILSVSDGMKLIDGICSMYSVDGVVSPANMDDVYAGYSRQILFIITIGFTLIAFVFGYLVKYMIISSGKENMICRLVGAGNAEIIGILTMENFLINIMLSSVAVIIHIIFFDSIFEKVNFYNNVKLKLNDYILIIGITSIFSFFAILPHIIKSVNDTLIVNKNRI